MERRTETVRVMLVGGPDVNARIPLMQVFRKTGALNVMAAGSEPGLADEFARSGFPYFSYPLHRAVNPVADLRTLYALVWLFRRVRPDVVHTFDTKPCVWGRLAARLAGVPIVVGTLPGLGSLYTTDSAMTRTVRFVYERLQKIACHLSDATIFQNQDDARLFVRRGLAPASKTHVIPGSGVRTDIFDPARVPRDAQRRLREELDLAPHTLVVTMIARLIRSKGVMEFAEAAARVIDQREDVRFVLVGPDDQASVDRLDSVEKERLTRHVHWLGPRQDVPVILAITDVFVLPTYYREGIPRVLLEAASMGVPIVTTDVPGCREVVEHNRTGFLVPPRDVPSLAQAILYLLDNAALRRRFGAAARRRARTLFDLKRIAFDTHALYMELLSTCP